MNLPVILLLAFAFLLGSIPFGLLVARFYGGEDLRKKGSGNIGATNVTRVLGFWPAGFFTLLLDALKGAAPVLLALPLGAVLWTHWFDGSEDFAPIVIWGAGFAAAFGHCFSPWLKFKGGKGVATGFGAIIVLSPWAALGGVLAFALAFLRTRTGSLASIAGLVVASVTHLVLHPVGIHLLPGLALVFMILARHESNLDAHLEDRERKF
jgi:acyl phosphate:glycerol-3-phosphate acyltransferase